MVSKAISGHHRPSNFKGAIINSYKLTLKVCLSTYIFITAGLERSKRRIYRSWPSYVKKISSLNAIREFNIDHANSRDSYFIVIF